MPSSDDRDANPESLFVQLESLSSVLGVITTSPDLDEALEVLLDRMISLSDADSGSIMLFEEDSHEWLRIYRARGLSREMIASVRVHLGEGISGRVAQTGEPVLLRRGERHPLSVVTPVAGYAAAICVPLKVRNLVLGVLNVRDEQRETDFTESDLRLATLFAGQAAFAIENRRLLDTVGERLAKVDSELVHTNEQLSVAQFHMQRILESIPDPVVVTDAVGTITMVNKAAETAFGRSRPLLLYRSLEQAVRVEDVRQALARFLGELGAEPLTREVSIGEPVTRIYSIHAAPLTRPAADQVIGYVMVLADITELRELSQLKSDMVSMTSHELRTPLTAIKGAAVTLERLGAQLEEERRRELLEMIVSESDRLATLVTNMLDLSRIESGRALDLQYARVDLLSLIERVVEMQRAYTDRHQFEVKSPPSVPRVVADPQKIEQVLINLLGNAVKYSPDGGPITVEVQLEDAQVAIAVTDRGIGIRPEDLPELFQRYRRAVERSSQKVVGAGLGLYIAKAIVEAHGGRIEANSVYGQGSTFRVTLPLEPPTPALRSNDQ